MEPVSKVEPKGFKVIGLALSVLVKHFNISLCIFGRKNMIINLY